MRASNGWSDERQAESVVNEFLHRDLLPETVADRAARRLADGDPLEALDLVVTYKRPEHRQAV